MSHSKHGASRGPNPLIFVIVALIIIAVALVVIILVLRSAPPEEPQPAAALPMLEEPLPVESVLPEDEAAEPEPAATAVTVAPAEEPAGDSMEIQEAPEGDVWVETPYGKLFYPFEMSDTLQVVSEPVDDGLTVTFYGGINDKTEALYAIHFGVDSGFPVGTLSAEDGAEVSVWADVFEIVPGDSWQEDEINTLYAMQECVNDTLEQLQNEAGFTAAE